MILFCKSQNISNLEIFCFIQFTANSHEFASDLRESKFVCTNTCTCVCLNMCYIICVNVEIAHIHCIYMYIVIPVKQIMPYL